MTSEDHIAVVTAYDGDPIIGLAIGDGDNIALWDTVGKGTLWARVAESSE